MAAAPQAAHWAVECVARRDDITGAAPTDILGHWPASPPARHTSGLHRRRWCDASCQGLHRGQGSSIRQGQGTEHLGLHFYKQSSCLWPARHQTTHRLTVLPVQLHCRLHVWFGMKANPATKMMPAVASSHSLMSLGHRTCAAIAARTATLTRTAHTAARTRTPPHSTRTAVLPAAATNGPNTSLRQWSSRHGRF